MQHDDPYDRFAAVLVEEEASEAAAAAEASAFDLCHVDEDAPAPLARHTPSSSRGAKQQQIQVLAPGMVLVKGFLDMDTQEEIVMAARELGKGPAGFIVPDYDGGAHLSLRMMCLGKHWEPRLKCYEDRRSLRDNATPPPVPVRLRELAAAGLQAARRALEEHAPKARPLPGMTPDVCLVNFYPPATGRLGMHQDKDESTSSLRSGAPVVSLSVGDSAEFTYSRIGPDDESPSVALLESGDLLVFGGPSRLVFHGVRKVLPRTAPPELSRRTNVRPGRINLTFRQL